MNKKSFPKVTGLTAKSLSSNTRTTKMAKSTQKSVQEKPARKPKPAEQIAIENHEEPYPVPAELICPRCKRSASIDEKFCTHCGETLF